MSGAILYAWSLQATNLHRITHREKHTFTQSISILFLFSVKTISMASYYFCFSVTHTDHHFCVFLLFILQIKYASILQRREKTNLKHFIIITILNRTMLSCYIFSFRIYKPTLIKHRDSVIVKTNH